MRTQTTAEVACEDTNNGEKASEGKKSSFHNLSVCNFPAFFFFPEDLIPMKKKFYFLSPKIFLVFILMYINFAAKFEK